MSETSSMPRALGGDVPGVRFPPPLVYIVGFLLGLVLDAVLPHWRPPAFARIGLGAIGVIVWLALDGAAMLQFQRARTPIPPVKPATTLVTSGPYRFTRNPMYLGMAILYVGLAFALDLIWSLAVLPVVVLVIDRHAIAREEPYLEARFGDRYVAYKRRVRRWL